MPLLRWMTLLGLALGLVAAGCAGGGCHTGPCPAGSVAPTIAETGAATTIQAGRGRITPDLSSIPTPEVAEKVLAPEKAETPRYREVTAQRCQCLAVANAAMANAIDTEGELSAWASDNCWRSQGQTAELGRGLLACQAIGDRNTAAADALELFYRLAEAEASHDLLESGLAEIDRAIADWEDLKAKGLKVEGDGGALRRKRTAMLDRRVRLQASIAQLNGALRERLGFPADDPTRIWPHADLTVTVAPVDIQRVVADGLACRSDLGSLRLMYEYADTISLRALRRVMQTVNPALGTSPSPPAILGALLGSGRKRHERQTRREQIAALLANGESAAAAEIRAAAEEVETQLRLIALARQQRDNWQQRLDDLKARRGADGATPFDVSAAQLELYQAEADLVTQVVAWKIAEVKLRKAQGVLPLECGLSLPQEACRPPRPLAD